MLAIYFFLFSTCILLSIHNVTSSLNAGSGGLTGDFLASILVNNFSVVGSTILLVTFFIIGITLWLKLSWVYIFEAIGGYGFIIKDIIFNFLKIFPHIY